MVRYVRYLMVSVFLICGMAVYDVQAMKKTTVITTIRVENKAASKPKVAVGSDLKLPALHSLGKKVYEIVQQLSTESGPDQSCFLLLLKATQENNLEAVKIIFRAIDIAIANKASHLRGIDVFAKFLRARTEGKKTVLHHAAIQGNAEVTEIIIEAYKKFALLVFKDKADRAKKIRNFVNARDAQERTPLHYAAEYGHLGVVKILGGKYKSIINAEDSNTNTSLDLVLAAVINRESSPVDAEAMIHYLIVSLGAEVHEASGDYDYNHRDGYHTSGLVVICNDLLKKALEQRKSTPKEKEELKEDRH